MWWRVFWYRTTAINGTHANQAFAGPPPPKDTHNLRSSYWHEVPSSSQFPSSSHLIISSWQIVMATKSATKIYKEKCVPLKTRDGEKAGWLMFDPVNESSLFWFPSSYHVDIYRSWRRSLHIFKFKRIAEFFAWWNRILYKWMIYMKYLFLVINDFL